MQFAGVSKRSAGLAAQTDVMGSTDRSLHVRSAAVEGLADALVLLTSLAMIATSLGLFAAGDLSFSSAFICSFAYLSSFGPVLAVCRLGTSLQATLASGARARSFGRGAPDRGRGRWCGCFLWRRGVRTRDVLLRRSRRQ